MRGRVAAGVVALAALLVSGMAYTADVLRTVGDRPVIAKAIKGEQCVEDVATMRREHMRMLSHQRDATVHGGIRGAKHSLKGCIECHAGATTRSVASTPTDFCVSCHLYTAVKIDCFECHASKSTSTVEARKP